MNVHAKPLTEGNLYRQLIALAIPLMAGNILQQLYNLIDALVIAHFAGTIEFSAIGVAGTVSDSENFVPKPYNQSNISEHEKRPPTRCKRSLLI